MKKLKCFGFATAAVSSRLKKINARVQLTKNNRSVCFLSLYKIYEMALLKSNHERMYHNFTDFTIKFLSSLKHCREIPMTLDFASTKGPKASNFELLYFSVQLLRSAIYWLLISFIGNALIHSKRRFHLNKKNLLSYKSKQYKSVFSLSKQSPKLN